MDPKDDMLVAAAPAFRDVASPMTEKNNVAADEIVLTPTHPPPPPPPPHPPLPPLHPPRADAGSAAITSGVTTTNPTPQTPDCFLIIRTNKNTTFSRQN